jgi:hypothetical protein
MLNDFGLAIVKEIQAGQVPGSYIAAAYASEVQQRQAGTDAISFIRLAGI